MFLEFCVIFFTLILWGYSFQRRPKNFPPGPNGVPFLGYAPFLGFKPPVTLGELSKKYGKIYSFFMGNHQIVVLNDIKDIRAALKTNVFAGRPKEKLLAMQVLPDGVVYNEGAAWEEQRRFAVKIFRDFGFGKQGMSENLQEEVADLVNYFRLQNGKAINPRAAISQATVNGVILKTLASERYPIGDPRAAEIQRMAHEGFIEPATDGATYFFPWLAKAIPSLTGYDRMMTAVNYFQDMWSNFIKEHEQTLTEEFSRDYIDVALKKIQATTDPSSSFYKEMGLKQLNNLLTAFFVGGTDTIASSTSFLLLYMIEHPDVMQKGQAELDRVVGRSRLPCLADRPNLPYIEAILAEVLRHSSIVPWSIFHSVTEDVEFEGFTIPKRTIILPNQWWVHHDPAHWVKPHEFNPERFIGEDGTFQKSDNLIPFCVGKRVCPAENVGMNGFFMFTAGLLQNFTFEKDPAHTLPRTDEPSPGLVMYPQKFECRFIERK